MTLKEKVLILSGADMLELHSIKRLGIPSLLLADGPMGIHMGKSTAFPASIALSATWNTQLAREFGIAIGKEYRNKGRHMWLGPCMCIVRIPHGGRNFETYGEDPYLNSRMAVATIIGVQSQKVIACAKHFACNNQEYDRYNINIVVDERTLREIYLPSFQAAVTEAGVWSVMTAYNRLNGYYCSASRNLQRDILKREWGFKGFVVSDWGAIHDTAQPANAGCDLEMDLPLRTGYYWGHGKLLAAVNNSQVSEMTINDKVRRILRAMFFTGIMEKPWPKINKKMEEHRPLARKIAAEGMVLLKNKNNILPLNKNEKQTIAIIGPTTVMQIGGGSSEVTPYHSISPLEGIKAKVGPDITILEKPGVPIYSMAIGAIDKAWLHLPEGRGHGVRAEYFDNPDLTGKPVVVKIEESINFDWNIDGPNGLNAGILSARWRTTLVVPETSEYSMGIAANDNIRLTVNGKLLIEDWNPYAKKYNEKNILLEADKDHEIVVEYFGGTGTAVAVLSLYNFGCKLFAEAVSVARKADIAIVFAGLTKEYESEGFDRPTMNLPGRQETLIKAVAKANPNTVVVMIAGSQVAMNRYIDGVAAFLQAWYPGQEGGHAIADILFGDVNPSGKLPITFIRTWQDHPCYSNYPGNYYTEGLYVGYRHFDKKCIRPLYPFGYGLSYTEFEYSDLVVDTSKWKDKTTITAMFGVKNSGDRTGAEVAQLYISDLECTVDRPVKELKAFAKVELLPREKKTVKLKLDKKAFCFYDIQSKNWIIEPGTFEISVGASSGDIRLNKTLKLS